MKMPRHKDRGIENRSRFWFLLADAIAVAGVSLFAPIPEEIRERVFAMSNELPGGPHSVGALFAVMAVALICARFISSRALRVVHAVCAGVYALFSISIVVAVFAGEYYTLASGAHLACIMQMHIRGGIEQQPLITDTEEDSDG